MANFTLATDGAFADGTSIGAYPADRWAGRFASGAPLGSATNSQSVSGQSVTFTGLSADTSYYATDSSGTRYLRFAVPAASEYQSSELLFATISLTATGDLVAAVTAKKIRVVSYAIVCSAGLTVNFESGTTDISGPMEIAANGGISFAGGPEAPAFETAAGTKLAMTISGTGNVRGHLCYVLV